MVGWCLGWVVVGGGDGNGVIVVVVSSFSCFGYLFSPFPLSSSFFLYLLSQAQKTIPMHNRWIIQFFGN